ncbi:MAG: hypothetical protein ACRECO_13195 [Xanthobacteraceae bacterium]
MLLLKFIEARFQAAHAVARADRDHKSDDCDDREGQRKQNQKDDFHKSVPAAGRGVDLKILPSPQQALQNLPIHNRTTLVKYAGVAPIQAFAQARSASSGGTTPATDQCQGRCGPRLVALRWDEVRCILGNVLTVIVIGAPAHFSSAAASVAGRRISVASPPGLIPYR